MRSSSLQRKRLQLRQTSLPKAQLTSRSYPPSGSIAIADCPVGSGRRRNLCQCSRQQDLLGPAGAPVPLTQLDRAAASLAAAYFNSAADPPACPEQIRRI